MAEYRLFPEEKQERAVTIVKDYLPEEAHLLQLSYTGGRAFGWGPENTDIDLRGFFALPDWFKTCHAAADKVFDITLKNTRDPDDWDIQYHRWNQYYDYSKPFYMSEKWDQDEFLSNCSAETVLHGYPHNINIQVHRMEENFQARSACHTYKEIMIPLHYLRTGEIESNVMTLLDEGDFDLEGLPQCQETYMEDLATAAGIDQETVEQEVYRLFDELGYELAKQTDYDHKPFYDHKWKQ